MLRPMTHTLLVLSLMIANRSSAVAADRILIGEVGSLTGAEATFGDSTRKGIDLAITDINAKGGVKGKKLEVKVYDDQGKPEEAATAMTRLIAQDKVTLVLGEVASSRSLAMAPIAERNKIPMITPSSTNPRVTKDGKKVRDFVFRVCFIDPFQGTVMAKFTRKNLKLSKVAILRDVGNDYSMGLADYFTAKFKELGGTIVADESYKAGDQDFKAQLTSLKGKKPEAVFIPGYYTDVALIARQARELNMKQPLLGGDGWESAKLYEIGGSALDNSYFSNHYSTDDPNPKIQNFVKRYKNTYGEVPDSMSALAYDAAMIAAEAMTKAKDLSGEAIRQILASTKGFKGVTGIINIDQDHNAVKPAVVLRIQDKKPHYVTTISP
ncbi:MAG: ABC transporter substrate-binding protein [Elusimicrobia bacterium]|nr:ABC transporter substrate-binding protein [Elusimicrobiota bacterium]